MILRVSSPHTLHSASDLFNIESSMQVPVLEGEHKNVPTMQSSYCFDRDVTEAILAGFLYRRNVLLHGYHGTGKSTHIEQVAARLNWPLMRVNLDGHISRMDLTGRDTIVLEQDKQITRFQEGILPWAMQRPCALVFDEYDAARPDVMFVLQRVLESEGRLTLPEQNRVVEPHSEFRLFATANTVGLGDATGMYHGTNPINQGQMDRWHIAAMLNYLAPEKEAAMIQAQVPQIDKSLIMQMVTLAGLVRIAFANHDISSIMSPRTVISWAENYQIFQDVHRAFRYAFLNKCDEAEYPVMAELYQRVFNVELPELIAI